MATFFLAMIVSTPSLISSYLFLNIFLFRNNSVPVKMYVTDSLDHSMKILVVAILFCWTLKVLQKSWGPKQLTKDLAGQSFIFKISHKANLTLNPTIAQTQLVYRDNKSRDVQWNEPTRLGTNELCSSLIDEGSLYGDFRTNSWELNFSRTKFFELTFLELNGRLLI